MNEMTYLEGKVLKRSLPVFQSPPTAEVSGPKRLLLAQGELANFHDGEEGIRYIAFIELRPRAIRGNHFRRVKEEQVYLLSGEVLLVVQDGEAGTPVSVPLRPGDLVWIATGIAHAFKPTEAGEAVEFSTSRFDPADVQRFKLI
jgi:uncharacterized RmlC-like cupin family protein